MYIRGPCEAVTTISLICLNAISEILINVKVLRIVSKYYNLHFLLKFNELYTQFYNFIFSYISLYCLFFRAPAWRVYMCTFALACADVSAALATKFFAAPSSTKASPQGMRSTNARRCVRWAPRVFFRAQQKQKTFCSSLENLLLRNNFIIFFIFSCLSRGSNSDEISSKIMSRRVSPKGVPDGPPAGGRPNRVSGGCPGT